MTPDKVVSDITLITELIGNYILGGNDERAED